MIKLALNAMALHRFVYGYVLAGEIQMEFDGFGTTARSMSGLELT
jgi:hypothetical protein